MTVAEGFLKKGDKIHSNGQKTWRRIKTSGGHFEAIPAFLKKYPVKNISEPHSLWSSISAT